MNRQEIAAMLAMISSLDGRRAFGEVDVIAWEAVVGDLRFADARDAVIHHYRTSTLSIMPATVHEQVKRMRRERLANRTMPIPDHIEPGDIRALLAWERAWRKAIADGSTDSEALRAAEAASTSPPALTPTTTGTDRYDPLEGQE